MDRFSASVDGDGVLTLDTGKITLGPLPIAVGQPGHHPAAHADRLHLMTDQTPAPVPDGTPEPAEPPTPPEERLPATVPPEHAVGRAVHRRRRRSRRPPA